MVAQFCSSVWLAFSPLVIPPPLTTHLTTGHPPGPTLPFMAPSSWPCSALRSLSTWALRSITYALSPATSSGVLPSLWLPTSLAPSALWSPFPLKTRVAHQLSPKLYSSPLAPSGPISAGSSTSSLLASSSSTLPSTTTPSVASSSSQASTAVCRQ